ncbi:recombinase family protein [Pedococcus sp. NPDC057267]|uniref:recombinase family protein n=1 Tax=Pedococcus sp. NPDC057267 TaxID=3346077 RepID=UPI00363641F9
MTTKAAIYCRISDDRGGAGLGVARQEADCRALVAARGWDVAQVFTDNDLSAYSGKPRPGYRALLRSAQANEFDAVVAWHSDRLHRSPVELEDFISVCEENDLQVVTVQSGEIDLGTPSGRMVARMLGSAARYESEHKSARQRRKHQEIAKAGKASGGGSRAYGFEPDFMTIRESEASMLRSLAARFLAGESIGSLVKWLQANNIPTTTDGQWKPSTLRRVLRSARISGQREYKGEIVCPAMWPAIITPEQTARIRAILDDPARKFRRAPRRYVLSGLLRCHACQGRMLGRPTESGTRRYVCNSGPGFTGCGKTFVNAEGVEELIARAVLMRLDSPQMAAALSGQSLTGDAVWEQEAAEAQAELEELAELKGRRVISTTEWLAARAPVLARLEASRRQLTADTSSRMLHQLVGRGDTLSREWASLPLTRQQAIIATVLDHAVVGPGRRGYNRFDPARVQPVWRF